MSLLHTVRHGMTQPLRRSLIRPHLSTRLTVWVMTSGDWLWKMGGVDTLLALLGLASTMRYVMSRFTHRLALADPECQGPRPQEPLTESSRESRTMVPRHGTRQLHEHSCSNARFWFSVSESLADTPTPRKNTNLLGALQAKLRYPHQGSTRTDSGATHPSGVTSTWSHT